MENIYNRNEGVKELKENQFIINKNKIILKTEYTNNLNGILIVYAPWCSHCVLSKDMWENFADLFNYKFNIFAVNTYNYRADNQKLVIPLNIKYYPTYKFINKNGNIKDYTGGKTEDQFLNFIIKNKK
jgi:thiol-disulfide isomerase/thioredoxin